MKQNKHKKNSLGKRPAASATVVAIAVVGIIILGAIFWKFLSPVVNNSKNQKIASAPGQTPGSQNSPHQGDESHPAITNGSALTFDKKEQSLSAGSNFSLKAMIDPNGQKISAVELHLAFDPAKLKLNSLTPGDAFSTVLAGAKIDNNQGTASIILGAPLGKSSVDSSATIATLNFQALSAGTATVSYTDKSMAAADNQSNNVVTSSQPASITIN